MKRNNMLSRAVIGLATAVTLLATAACSTSGNATSGGDSDAGGEPVDISLSSPYAETALSATPYKSFADVLDAESDGRISVETFWAGALFPYNESLASIGSGLVDTGPLAVVYTPNDLPLSYWAVPLASYADDDPSFFTPMLTNSVATLSLMKEPEFQAEADAAGVVVIAGFVTDPSVLICTNPVESAADAEGLIARGTGIVELEAMGTTPSSLPFSEAYEALQRGVIDCTVNPIGTAGDIGLFDVASNVVDVRLAGSVNWLAINKDKFDALSEGDQKIVRSAGLAYMRDATVAQIEAAAATLAEDGAGAGTAITRPDDLVDILVEAQKKQIDGLAAVAPAGLGEDNATRVLDAYKAEVAELTERLQEAGFDTEGGTELREAILQAASPESIAAVEDYFESLRDDVLG